MHLFEDTRAQSIQIGAILMFAILIISFSTYQAFIIPDQNREVEFNHFTDTQEDMENLRNNIITAGEEGRDTRTSISLGTSYPARLVAAQPQTSSGTIRVDQIGSASNEIEFSGTSETANSVCGIDSVNTGVATYQPIYNYLSSVGNITYENTLSYTNGGFEGRSFQTDQQLVQDTTIQLYPLLGTFNRGGSGSRTVTTYGNKTGIASISGSFSLILPTRLSATTWEESLLADQAHVSSVNSVSDRTAVQINFDDANYEVRCSPVSPTGPPNNDPATTASDSGNVGPAVTSLETRVTEVVQGTPFDLTATISDSNRGGRDIIAAEWFSNRSTPGGSAGSGYTLSPTDGEFDQSVEDVQDTSIDTSGWTMGWHEISVRGQDAGPLWGPSTTVDVKIVDTQLSYNGDATALDGPDNPINDEPGGVEFSIKNPYNSPATITGLSVTPSNSNINELDDQVGDGNNDPEEVEIYARSPNNPDSYSDWGTNGFEADFEALPVPFDVEVGASGDNINSGNNPVVDSENNLTFYLYEFYESTDATDYETNSNINMSGEELTVTLDYEVDGNSYSDTFTITPTSGASSPTTDNPPTASIDNFVDNSRCQEGNPNDGNPCSAQDYAEFDVDWSASDDNGLSSVTIELQDSTGTVIDSESPSVSGTTATGDGVTLSDTGGYGDDYTIVVRATDTNGQQGTDSQPETADGS